MHTPVLLKEVIEYLDLKKGDTVLDATINGGGHSREIVKHIVPDGTLVGIDQDEEILKNLRFKIQDLGFKNIFLINGNFRDLDKLLKIKKLDAALFDLGMSSFHLEKSGRGFSFQKDEPLVMNYKSKLSPIDLTAKEILNRWTEEEICKILKEYGEEERARSIARKIIVFRERRPFKTTLDLVEAIGGQRGRINSATKTFQALRIAANDELDALAEGLGKAWKMLNPKGRLVVISFHSLEDRIVKNFFKQLKQKGEGEILTKKPVRPREEEIKNNPRSRSAKLRAIIKGDTNI